MKTYARKLSASGIVKYMIDFIDINIASNDSDENKGPKRNVVTSATIQVPSSLVPQNLNS